MLMGLFEIRVFDTYTTPLYPDGQAASVYGQTPPMVNACRPPGQWQSYDIIFFAPVFKGGKLESPARGAGTTRCPTSSGFVPAARLWSRAS